MGKNSKPKKLIILNIMLMVILGQMAIDIYLPAFPMMLSELHTTPNWIQMTLTVYLGFFGLGQLMLSPLSDQFGRKPIIKFGLLLYVLGALFSGLSQTIFLELLARSLQGLGASVFSGVARAVARDSFSGKTLAQIFSLLSTAWATVPSMAPVIGGYILRLGHWAYIFYFLAGASLIGLGIALRYLPETNKHPEKIKFKRLFKDSKSIISHRPFYANVIICLVIYNILIATNLVGPFLFQEVLGLTPVGYGWLVLFMCTGYLISVILNRILLKYFEIVTLQRVGLAGAYCMTVVGIICSYFYQVSLWGIALPLFFMQLSIGLIYPNSVANALSSFNKQIGLVSSIYGFMLYCGSTLMSLTLVYLPDNTQNPLMGFILFQLIITSIMMKLLSQH